MASLIPMAIGGLQSGAQARNSGQSSGFLGGPNAIDGSTQSLWNAIDPGNISGHSSSGHILSNVFDPGNVFGFNQAANPNAGQNGANSANGGVPSVLPNLGASSMIPQMPGGAFQPFNGGGGPFNQMAAQSAGGQMFNPAGQQNPQQQGFFIPGTQIPAGNPKGANTPSPMQRPMFSMGNIPRGYQRQ